jgi:hypothetical protein
MREIFRSRGRWRTFTVCLSVSLSNTARLTGCTARPPPFPNSYGHGGIDQVRWAINPWGTATASETSDGCYQGSCIRVDTLSQMEWFSSIYTTARLFWFPPSRPFHFAFAQSPEAPSCQSRRATRMGA